MDVCAFHACHACNGTLGKEVGHDAGYLKNWGKRKHSLRQLFSSCARITFYMTLQVQNVSPRKVPTSLGSERATLQHRSGFFSVWSVCRTSKMLIKLLIMRLLGTISVSNWVNLVLEDPADNNFRSRAYDLRYQQGHINVMEKHLRLW